MKLFKDWTKFELSLSLGSILIIIIVGIIFLRRAKLKNEYIKLEKKKIQLNNLRHTGLKYPEDNFLLLRN